MDARFTSRSSLENILKVPLLLIAAGSAIPTGSGCLVSAASSPFKLKAKDLIATLASASITRTGLSVAQQILALATSVTVVCALQTMTIQVRRHRGHLNSVTECLVRSRDRGAAEAADPASQAPMH